MRGCDAGVHARADAEGSAAAERGRSAGLGAGRSPKQHQPPPQTGGRRCHVPQRLVCAASAATASVARQRLRPHRERRAVRAAARRLAAARPLGELRGRGQRQPQRCLAGQQVLARCAGCRRGGGKAGSAGARRLAAQISPSAHGPGSGVPGSRGSQPRLAPPCGATHPRGRRAPPARAPAAAPRAPAAAAPTTPPRRSPPTGPPRRRRRRCCRRRRGSRRALPPG
jgi:hypothetical protein